MGQPTSYRGRVVSSASARSGALLRDGRPSLRGRAAAWLTVGIALLCTTVLLWHSRRSVSAVGFAQVETSRASFAVDRERNWIDSRWEQELRHHAALFPAFQADDARARLALADSLVSLSFVEAVGEPRVIWPDGVEIPVLFRSPVACVEVRGHYRPVAEDGTLLSGLWSAPPRIDQRWLPVIGPLDGAFDERAPGERLGHRRHVDGLSIAISMARHLAPADFELLGRSVIDATRAPFTSDEDEGALILLEGRRLVAFGRAPSAGEPGSLPVERKWRWLADGLESLRDGPGYVDWDLLDVRWDFPEMRLREPELGLAR